MTTTWTWQRRVFVLQPANGCSAHRWLVEINFLMLKQLFSGLHQFHLLHVFAMFLHVYCVLSFLFSLFCSFSDGKSCLSVKKLISTSKLHNRWGLNPGPLGMIEKLVICYIYNSDAQSAAIFFKNHSRWVGGGGYFGPMLQKDLEVKKRKEGKIITMHCEI